MQEAGTDERQREGSAVLGPVACNSTTTRLAEAEAVALAPNQLGVDQEVQRGTSPIGPPQRCHTGSRASWAGIALPLLGSAASATPSRRTRGAVSHDDGAGTSASAPLSQQVAQQRLEVTAIAVDVFRE